MNERVDGSEGLLADGLEGIVAAETVLSEIDGERGELIIRGYSLEDLAARATFEDACGLLWYGALPDARGREEIRARLGAARVAAFATLRLEEAADPMDALRAGMSRLSPSATRDETRFALTGAMAVIAASWRVRSDGGVPRSPDASLGHAADYLRMMDGVAPSPERVAALDAYLVTVIDHGMNASTFTARVIASTRSDAVSAVVGAIGALKGPAHGGAPGPVLDMLDAIGRPEAARPWIEAELAAGRRIMGMGHRVYRARDPRAAVLEGAIERLEVVGVGRERLALARAVERTALEILTTQKPERPLKANVEFYTAVLLAALGLPGSLFTPTFAVSRVAGWLAHIEEQGDRGRLMRPSSRYVGPRVVRASVMHG